MAALKNWKIVTVIIALLGIVALYFILPSGDVLDPNAIINQTPEEAQKEIDEVLSKLSKLMLLPTDEQPVLATVTDVETLVTQQAFFQGAQNGDKLLMYTKNLKAIIYSPSRNIVINVGPIQANGSIAETLATTNENTQANQVNQINQENVEQVVATPMIAYFNGTEIAGLSSQTEKVVLARFPDFKTATLSNAAKSNYTTTTVVVLNQNFSNEANQIGSLLNANVTNVLPEGETSPQADIVIIVGQ